MNPFIRQCFFFPFNLISKWLDYYFVSLFNNIYFHIMIKASQNETNQINQISFDLLCFNENEIFFFLEKFKWIFFITFPIFDYRSLNRSDCLFYYLTGFFFKTRKWHDDSIFFSSTNFYWYKKFLLQN